MKAGMEASVSGALIAGTFAVAIISRK